MKAHRVYPILSRIAAYQYFGIKGPAVREVIKMIEERWYGEIKLRKEIEYLREIFLNEFWRFAPELTANLRSSVCQKGICLLSF
jgi:hypothetical protein